MLTKFEVGKFYSYHSPNEYVERVGWQVIKRTKCFLFLKPAWKDGSFKRKITIKNEIEICCAEPDNRFKTVCFIEADKSYENVSEGE